MGYASKATREKILAARKQYTEKLEPVVMLDNDKKEKKGELSKINADTHSKIVLSNTTLQKLHEFANSDSYTAYSWDQVILKLLDIATNKQA